MTRILMALTLFVAAAIASRTAYADVIELEAGDTIHAEVIKITADVLTIRHPIFGEVDIPRDQIRGIVLGKKNPSKKEPSKKELGKQALGKESPGKTAPAGGGPTSAAPGENVQDKRETPKEIIDRLVNKEFGPAAVKKLERGAVRQPTPEDAVEQLRIEGVDPRLRSSLHMMLPGFGAPEVQTYFDSRVNGLMDGSMTIQDIRKDAVGARDQLKEIMDDLGADGTALQGYFSILDNFIDKTAPPKP